MSKSSSPASFQVSTSAFTYLGAQGRLPNDYVDTLKAARAEVSHTSSSDFLTDEKMHIMCRNLVVAYSPHSMPNDQQHFSMMALRARAGRLAASELTFSFVFFDMLEVMWAWYASWSPWLAESLDMKAYAYQLIEQAPEKRMGMFCYCLARCLATETYQRATVNLSNTAMYDFLRAVFLDEKAHTLATTDNLRRLICFANESPGKYMLHELRKRYSGGKKSIEEADSVEAALCDQIPVLQTSRRAGAAADFAKSSTVLALRRNESSPSVKASSLSLADHCFSLPSTDSKMKSHQPKTTASSLTSIKEAQALNSTLSTPDHLKPRLGIRPASKVPPTSSITASPADNKSTDAVKTMIIGRYTDLKQNEELVTMPQRGDAAIPTFPWLIYNVLRRCGPILTLSELNDYIIKWCPGRLKEPQPGAKRSAKETLNSNLRHNLSVSNLFVSVPKAHTGRAMGAWRIKKRNDELAEELDTMKKIIKVARLPGKEKIKQLPSPPTTLEGSPSTELQSSSSDEDSTSGASEARSLKRKETVAGPTVSDDETEDTGEEGPAPKRRRHRSRDSTMIEKKVK